jgi:hypothetical protein
MFKNELRDTRWAKGPSVVVFSTLTSKFSFPISSHSTLRHSIRGGGCMEDARACVDSRGTDGFVRVRGACRGDRRRAGRRRRRRHRPRATPLLHTVVPPDSVRWFGAWHALFGRL